MIKMQTIPTIDNNVFVILTDCVVFTLLQSVEHQPENQSMMKRIKRDRCSPMSLITINW